MMNKTDAIERINEYIGEDIVTTDNISWLLELHNMSCETLDLEDCSYLAGYVIEKDGKI